MIHLNKLYENFNSEYGTSQLGFFRPHIDFVPALVEISFTIFNKLVGVQPRNQKIQDWLTPFRKTLNIAVLKSPSYEYVPYPKEPLINKKYEYKGFDNCGIIVERERICGQVDCDLLTKDQCVPSEDLAEDFFPQSDTDYEERPVHLVVGNKWKSLISHPSLRPTLKRPAIKQIEEGFQILPKGIGVVVLNYFRSPIDPVFNYDVIVDGPDEYLQFKEEGSTHLEWSDVLTPVFLYHLGKRYGLTMGEQLILQVRQLDKIFE